MKILIILILFVGVSFADEVYKCEKDGEIFFTTSPQDGMKCQRSRDSSATLVKKRKGEYYYDAKTDTYYRKVGGGWLNMTTNEWKETLE